MEVVDKVKIGTVLKMAVLMVYDDESISIDDIDFRSEWKTYKDTVAIAKVDHIKEELEGGIVYYAYVDTALLGVGNLTMCLHANIPDADAPGGYRIDNEEVGTGIMIY